MLKVPEHISYEVLRVAIVLADFVLQPLQVMCQVAGVEGESVSSWR
jgi:hypothetical protein